MTLPIDGYALTLKKSKDLTAALDEGRLFLFMRTDNVKNKSYDADDYYRERKQVRICNIMHTHHPLARAKSVTAYRQLLALVMPYPRINYIIMSENVNYIFRPQILF